MQNMFDALTKGLVKIHRKRQSVLLYEAFDGVVQRGPFKGFKLPSKSNISKAPLGLKIFGLFETEVLAEIQKAAPFDTFINFGAADGYMSLGPLFAGWTRRSICFEITEKGRRTVTQNARDNDLAEKVTVRGAAEPGIGKVLEELDALSGRAVLLCDIDTAEFEVFDAALFDQLAGVKIIIELHDMVMEDGPALRAKMLEDIGPGRDWRIIKARPADWSGIDMLENMHDNDRALITSYGRKAIGEWLVVEPRPAWD